MLPLFFFFGRGALGVEQIFCVAAVLAASELAEKFPSAISVNVLNQEICIIQ